MFAFEKKVLQMLGNDDLRECENRLVEDLGFEHFAVIRKLLKNRHKVYFCTLLGQAQNADEKENVLREMKRSIDGIRVLELVQSETGRARRKAHGRTDTNVPSSTISIGIHWVRPAAVGRPHAPKSQ